MAVDTQFLGKRMNELLVLSTLRSGARHGYQIALEVESRSGGAFELQHGTLYPILHRLEREGLIRGRWQKEAGRQRKEYVLTRAGRRHLRCLGILRFRRDEEVARVIRASRCGHNHGRE